MILASSLAFFLVVFLIGSIGMAIAWMAFLKMRAEQSEAADMETEAATAGFYHSPGWNKDYAKIQVLTIAELLAGRSVQMPPVSMTFKQAEKVRTESGARQHELF